MITPKENYKKFLLWKKNNPEKYALSRKNYRKNHWNRIHDYNLKYYREHREKYRIKARDLSESVFRKYGGKCSCCGEEISRFLNIDHLHRNGKMDRLLHHGSYGFFRHLLKEKRNDREYRVLCMNCNWATRFGEKCPHQN
jgi:hypothetical protein